MSPPGDISWGPEVERLFDTLVDLPQTDRGRSQAMKPTCPPVALQFAANFIDAHHIDDLVESWLREDNPNRERQVGRPEDVSPRAYLIASLGCALANLPVAFTQIHHVLTTDMPKATRQVLGFPTSDDAHEDLRLDRRRRAISYSSVWRTATKTSLTWDPRPFPSRRGLTGEEVASIDAARDWSAVEERQRRLDFLSTAMLLGCWAIVPRWARRQWKGDASGDGTFVPIYGQKGHGSRRRKVEGARSPEVLAGWGAKETGEREKARLGAQNNSVSTKEWTHALETHPVVAVARDRR